ncbi:MAG: hypothetical protein ACJZ68_07675 [Limisphaerales bacterium]
MKIRNLNSFCFWPVCFWPVSLKNIAIFSGIKNAVGWPAAERHTANWKGIMKALPPQRIAQLRTKK